MASSEKRSLFDQLYNAPSNNHEQSSDDIDSASSSGIDSDSDIDNDDEDNDGIEQESPNDSQRPSHPDTNTNSPSNSTPNDNNPSIQNKRENSSVKNSSNSLQRNHADDYEDEDGDENISSDAATIEPDAQDVTITACSPLPSPSPPSPVSREPKSQCSQKPSQSPTSRQERKRRPRPKKSKRPVYSRAPTSPMNIPDNEDENPSSFSPSSSSSGADTIPPPSPSALARVRPSAASAPILIINPDNEDIIHYDLHQTHHPSSVCRPYPRLDKDKDFEFKEKKEVQDLHLSSLTDNDKPDNFPIDLPKDSGYLPSNITAALSKYQRDGVTFMYRIFERERGALLADAMGLGKTIQTICFLGAAYGIWDRLPPPPSTNDMKGYVNRNAAKILVVAPAAVRTNWKREFEKWSPFLVAQYEPGEEPELSRRFRNGSLDVLITGDHAVVNHASFIHNPPGDYDSDGDSASDDSDDIAINRNRLKRKGESKKHKWAWDVMIIDEIHIAKNARTKTYQGLKDIPRVCAFGLTGTPIQNDLSELYNVLSLVVPPKFLRGPKDFKNHFKVPITRGTKRNASTYMRQKAEQRIAELRHTLSKHMVRRPKSTLDKELPHKTDTCVLMGMKREGIQGNMYYRFHNSYDVKLLRDAQQLCDCGSEEKSKECCHRFPTTKEDIENAPIWRSKHANGEPCDRCPTCINFSAQYYAKCISAHAFLMLPEDDELDKLEERMSVLRYLLGEKHENILNKPLDEMERDPDVSCKLNVALKLIRNYQRNGHKTIIFYESLRLGRILQRWATKKGLVYAVIDGSVNKGFRQNEVDRFNTDRLCEVFFISKRAGGTGLNITAADRVLIFEPCWNPSQDLQAGDRAHRLGQKRGVQMIRLVVEHTIEHYVFKTGISKTQISSAIVDNTNEQWSIKDDEVGTLHAMYSVGNDAYVDDVDSQGDDFKVVGVDTLVDSECKQEEELERTGNRKFGNNGRRDKEFDDGMGDDSPPVNIFGESDVVCSLNVDIDVNASGWISHADNTGDSKQTIEDDDIGDDEDMVDDNVDIYNDADDEPEIDKDSDSGRDMDKRIRGMSDSQTVSDLLDEAGASKRVVITSTHAGKRKEQVLGRSVKGGGGGGINAAGPGKLDLNDTKWKQPSDYIDDGNESDIDVDEQPIRRQVPLAVRSTRSTARISDKPVRKVRISPIEVSDTDEEDEMNDSSKDVNVMNNSKRTQEKGKDNVSKNEKEKEDLVLSNKRVTASSHGTQIPRNLKRLSDECSDGENEKAVKNENENKKSRAETGTGTGLKGNGSKKSSGSARVTKKAKGEVATGTGGRKGKISKSTTEGKEPSKKPSVSVFAARARVRR